MNQNSISHVSPLNALQDAIQGGQKLVVSEHAHHAAKESMTLSLTILNVGQGKVTLQVDSSKQKLQIPVEQLIADGQLNKGDRLVLTGVKGELAKLVVSTSGLLQNASLKQNQAIPPQVMRELASQWPNISPHDISKIVTYPILDKIIKSPLEQKQLAQTLLKLASSALNNVQVSIQGLVNKVGINNIQVEMHDNGRTLPVTLPVNLSKLQNIKPEQVVQMKLAVNPTQSNNVVISQLKIDASPLAFNELKTLNQKLTNANQVNLNHLLKDNLFNPSNQVTSPDILIIKPNKALLEQVLPKQIQTLDITQKTDNLLAVAKYAAPNGKTVHLTLVPRPVTVMTPVESLHGTGDANSSADSTPRKNEGTSKQYSIPPEPNSSQNTESINKSTYKTSLLDKLGNGGVSLLIDKFQKQITQNLSLLPSERGNSTSIYPGIAQILAKLPKESSDLVSQLLMAKNQKLTTEIMPVGKQEQSSPPAGSQITEQGIRKIVENLMNQSEVFSEFDYQTTEQEHNSRQLLQQTLSSALSPQLLSMKALMNQSQNSAIDGLVSLLTIRLLGKISPQSEGYFQLANMLSSKLSKNNDKASPQSVTKAAHDLEKLDGSATFFRAISNSINQRQFNALRSAENSLQGQDSLYFTLPNLISPENKDLEIKIRREQSKEESSNQRLQTHWLLDMKLDIGKQGEILAKTKVIKNKIELSLYASSEQLTRKAQKFLPLLSKRLESLGLQINNANCYTAKIPPSIMQTHLSTMNAFA
ncbi:hypothetical protein [Glaciecola sp. 1036]|uniref:hypothetical protein n=1 Tax=Alteromonadaceae TaxID=72275 RepID=UPI003D03EF62